MLLKEGKRLDEARFHFRQAALQGHEESAHRFSIMCAEGKGGNVDLDAALEILRDAADNKKKAKACHNMAAILLIKGSAAHQKSARSYFKLGADQGCGRCDYQYAVMCLNGTGGARKEGIAKDYFERAAHKGHKKAQEALDKIRRKIKLSLDSERTPLLS
ncbi:hypothetical protein OAN21_01995 [Alphaproteobacteria bacterium]|jgi:TPR repeat protein|nr:hypothetical protein [Alphaproteobacteria bacterium]